ncbi:hypothetical protein Bbelb_406520, partial [Branchiostoma belcheri]
QGELTFAQLYEGLVAASEFRPYNFKQVLSRSATLQCKYSSANDEKVGRGIEVYSGSSGVFIRMVIDKTAATTEAVPRPKTAFEHQENKVSRSGCFQPMLGLGAHNNVAITTQCSDMHFTSSTVLLFSQTEVRGDEDDAAFGVLELW